MRVLYTDGALYIGVLCHDRSPREIVSTQLTRDAELDVDDRILIVLDPFFDHRNGFFFEVNPAGARADGQVSNNAERLSLEWDGIWNAVARITDEGWIAEIEIPFKTLRFKPDQTTWGFNVERQIKRRQEIDRWTAARQNIWIGNLAEAGSARRTRRRPAGARSRPPALRFGRARTTATPNCARRGCLQEPDIEPQRGHHGEHRLRRDRSRSPSGEPDAFSTVLPREASFFLEGAGVFDVAGLVNTTDIRPFFSRRIGSDSRTSPCQLCVGRQADRPAGSLQRRRTRRRDRRAKGRWMTGGSVSDRTCSPHGSAATFSSNRGSAAS